MDEKEFREIKAELTGLENLPKKKEAKENEAEGEAEEGKKDVRLHLHGLHNRFAYEAPVDDEANSAWMLTYIDVMTLLLTLFVVLLGYSSIEKESYSEMTGSISRELQTNVGMLEGGSLIARTDPFETKYKAMLQSLVRTVARQDMSQNLQFSFEDNKIQLTLNEKMLFPSASATLSQPGKEVLNSLLDLIQTEKFHIAVEGHSDNQPITSEQFPSNWELSSARSINVVKYLISKNVSPQRLTATAHAETQPIADNSTAEGRAKNRRVMLTFDFSNVE